MSTFVSVGNATQPFSRLLDSVARYAEQLPQPVVVQYGHTPFSSPACEAYPFLSMEQFVSYMDCADVVIVHAGAGSVLNAIRAGKVPVVMPRRAEFGEHIDDHQMELANALAEEGRIVLTNDDQDLLSAVEKAITIQTKTSGHHEQSPPMVRVIGELLDSLASDM